MTAIALSSNRPLVVNKNVVTYKGAGYLYHFRKTAADYSAKLKISAKMLELFVKQCGSINTRNLPGLTVACQGGGWYEVFTVNDALSQMVLRFLQRLNRWMLNQIQSGPKPKAKAHRFVEARKFEHAQTKNQPVPGQFLSAPQRPRFDPTAAALNLTVASESKVADMVSKFKAKFGKVA